MSTLEERVASMPTLIPIRLAAACALALALILSTAAVAAAKGPIADLRVVNSSGRVLTEDSLASRTATIRTSPRATCFGAGTGGSGDRVTVKGPTALSLLILASRSTPTLGPLLISDAFDFGLALCGVGGFSATSKLSWYLKVNHENPELGGEAVRVRAGDEVLWALAAFPYPAELALEAPDRATPGRPFKVRVFGYDERGRRKPVAGAKVTGGTALTGADGRTTVVLKRPKRLIARHGKDIPSNRETVCVGGKCPRG
jgi:hypothetical protein